MALSDIFDTVGTFLGGIKTYLIVGAAMLLLGGLGGAWAGYRWEHGTVLSLQASAAQVASASQVKASKSSVAQAKVNEVAGIKEATAQAAIQTKTITITKEIPVYVHDQVVCPGPSVGLARVLRAAADGRDPSTLDLAPGQSDDDCSDFTSTEVAGWFTQYAAAARANAEQLNAIEAWVQANHKAQEDNQ